MWIHDAYTVVVKMHGYSLERRSKLHVDVIASKIKCKLKQV